MSKHRADSTMRTDDPVAPGIRRSKAALITAIGLVVVLGAIAFISLTLSRGVENAQQDATLSKDETRQLREFLADRGKQRDAERNEVQQQLDDQRAVLCAAISTLSAAARPEARTVLVKAAQDLQCSSLPRSATRSSSSTPTPSATSSPSAARTSSPRTARPSAAAPRAAAPAPSSTVRPGPSPTTARPTATSTPTPRPSPSPSTSTPAPSRGPITGPVCDLLGICL